MYHEDEKEPFLTVFPPPGSGLYSNNDRWQENECENAPRAT
jgi:hypothetical protein